MGLTKRLFRKYALHPHKSYQEISPGACNSEQALAQPLPRQLHGKSGVESGSKKNPVREEVLGHMETEDERAGLVLRQGVQVSRLGGGGG